VKRLALCCAGAPRGFGERRRARRATFQELHPLLSVVLALVFAVLGAIAALSHSVDEDPKLAIAKEWPAAVETLLAEPLATPSTPSH
jgi:hypothetical protein